MQFVQALQKAWKFKIECIQTDNGTEFTNRFTSNRDKPSLLDLWCRKNNCVYKLIKPKNPDIMEKLNALTEKTMNGFMKLTNFTALRIFKNN